MRDRAIFTTRSAILATALLAGLLAVPAPAPAAEVGDPAPAFKAEKVLNMPRTAVPLQKLRGRIVLLEVFNIWSDHCVQAVEQLHKLRDKHGAHGLTVLGVVEAEAAEVAKWMEQHRVKYPVAICDTPSYEGVTREYHFPGQPWAFLIDPKGKLMWAGHPMEVKDAHLKALYDLVTAPPRLPEEFAAAQELLDGGRWAEAHGVLAERGEDKSLDRTLRTWAKGTAAWIERRRGRIFPEAEEKVKAGQWFDAWQMYVDFGTRFAGMEGVEEAATRAAAIRADKEAKKDLEAGDYVEKLRDLIERQKWPQARQVAKKAQQRYKGTRHADRAKALAAAIPSK